jgi:diguanylate cyclase (GGDEF)-like protein/PAS domain S-box-containing protein
MKRRAWLLYLVGGVVMTLLYLFGPSFLRIGPVFNLVSASAVVAILLGVRLHKPDQRLPWYLFAAGMTFFMLGDVITYNYERFFHTALPFPSVGDVFYLLVYPCLIAGILLLIARRNPGGDRASLIDSLIISIGAGVLSWVFLMAPYWHDQHSTLVEKLVSISYPFMDLLLLTVIVRMAVGAGKRERSFYLLLVSVLCLLATDAFYGLVLLGNYPQNGLLEGGWAMFYILWAAAALHPSMQSLSEPAPDQEVRLTRPRLALLAGASLMAPAVIAIQQLLHQPIDVPIVVSASMALFLLVVGRMAGLVHKQEQSVTREKALREAGAALVTATNRESIYTAALDAAGAVTGASYGLRLCLVSGFPAQLEVTASVGGEVENATFKPVKMSTLPDTVSSRLFRRRSVEIGAHDASIRKNFGYPLDGGPAFVAPLFMRDELKGVFVVAGEGGIPRVVRDGLDALVSQVALALESAELTEDLLRRQSEARFSSLVQNSSDVVMVIEPDTRIGYLTPSIENVFGYLPEELEGTRFADLVHPDDKTRILTFLQSVTKDPESHFGLTECRVLHKNGSWIHVETLPTNLLQDENVRGIVLNTRDISERKAFEEQLSHQAFHDSVTNLANRALFRDRVEHALERQLREDRPLAVLFLDLDDFKTINDSLGHAAGDQLLYQVGERLKTCLRSADTAARLGGDEFAILLEDVGEGVEAAEVAERIMGTLDGSFTLEDKEVFVRASVGIVIGTSEALQATDAEDLLRNADVAMYMAKEQGKGRYQVFEPAMHATVLERLELKADLQRAVENDEFTLHYQPVIILKTGRISGFEALVRWNHPSRGLVPPLSFIPLAEETGIIVPLGRWVLEEACRQIKLLQQSYPSDPPLSMAVNLSARQLQRPEIVQEVTDAMSSTGVDPKSLVLEITESVMMEDMELSIERLRELKELGVELAVDDFGTGYSSLNYIRRFPVDILKVDKSFIDGINEEGEDSALTAAIIELAGILRLQPVAEGIETAEQLARLLELDCGLGQGYYFAKPLAEAALRDLLSAESSQSGEPAIAAI